MPCPECEELHRELDSVKQKLRATEELGRAGSQDGSQLQQRRQELLALIKQHEVEHGV